LFIDAETALAHETHNNPFLELSGTAPKEIIVMLRAYAKTEQADLSERQRKEILRFLEEFDHG
jgi:hypothetical protein